MSGNLEATLYDYTQYAETDIWPCLAVIVRTPGTHVVRHGSTGLANARGSRLAAAARRAARKPLRIYGGTVHIRNNPGSLLIVVKAK